MSPLMPQAVTYDPKKAECSGLYLYGSGYYAREDAQVAILRGERAEANFCNGCPVRERCEAEHRLRAESKLGTEVEEFKRQVAAVKRKGGSELIVSAMRMKQGDPDPYMKLALENYQRGVTDRRRLQGSPIIRRG